MPTAHPSFGRPRPPSPSPSSPISSSLSPSSPPSSSLTPALSSSSSSVSPSSYRFPTSSHSHSQYRNMNDKDDSAQQDYNGQQHRYPSTSYDLHRNQYHEHSVYENTYHHESPYHYQRRNSNNTDMPHHYLQRGHRHSTDSAAADTLLMLSAAAFMDPDAIRLVTSTTPNGAAADEGDYRFHRSTPSFGEERQHHYHHHQPYQQQQPQQHRPLMMAKTVSAPVSSSHRTGLHPLSRPLPPRPRDMIEETTYMDMEVEPTPSSSSSHTVRRPSAQCSTDTQTLFTKGPAGGVGGSRHHSPPSSRFVPPPPSGLISSANASLHSNATTATAEGDPHVTTQVSPLTHGSSSEMMVDPATTARPSFTINKESAARRVKGEHEDTADRLLSQGQQEAAKQDEEEEEEEDEVMSEGVVHVNNYLAPIALSLPNKIPLPQILTLALPQQQQQRQSSHGQDPPKTPTSARIPRTPKQARTPKNARPTKRSQNDSISVSNGSGPPPSLSSGRGGKNSTRDSNPVDYFYSPFPPSTCSPVSSPSSPSAFQAQLQQLTNRFVSIQPHASPTSRFRRTNASAMPFSPPASPGQDLVSLTHSSPTKSHGGHSARSTGANNTKANLKPKWHTQPYMMFLALRAMPNRTAPRQELIHAAVELDKKFSTEKGLPRVFTGKTPMNSASACLTNNGDKYFIPFKPEGSRSTHFRLTYQPGDFSTAVADYNGWMEELIRYDWPLCFGVPKNENAEATMKRGPDTEDVEQDEDLLLQLSSGGTSKKIKASATASPTTENTEETTETGVSPSSFTTHEINSLNHIRGMLHHNNSSSGKATSMGVRRLDLDAAGRLDEPNSCPPTPATATALELEHRLQLDDSPVIVNKKRRVEDLDLSRVPSSLAEVVEVKESLIPHAGRGLFAKIDLPAGTPLGFYFGVPMTENEFDSLKEGVGAASQYAIMYRKTVLDATDEQGRPFKQELQGSSGDGQGQMVVEGQMKGEELLCPFHYLNEDKDGNVSFITGSQVNQVICTTNRAIQAGDELLVFFPRESERHWPVAAPSLVAAAVKLQAPEVSSVITAASSEQQGQEGSGSNGGDRWSRDAGTASPSPSGRPRRETANKPVRYSR